MKQNQVCKHCKFFVQHYARVDGVYIKIYCGHCINLNKKENCGYKKVEESCNLFAKKIK